MGGGIRRRLGLLWGGLFKMWSLTAQIIVKIGRRFHRVVFGGSGAGGVDGNENDNH
jgi:hypothetical protein